jgi:predicted nucleic acid-binding protein
MTRVVVDTNVLVSAPLSDRGAPALVRARIVEGRIIWCLSSFILAEYADSPDEPDNRFLECAEAAQADYLVTGNTRHFPKKWKQTSIVTPRQLILALKES